MSSGSLVLFSGGSTMSSGSLVLFSGRFNDEFRFVGAVSGGSTMSSGSLVLFHGSTMSSCCDFSKTL
jgi:hypothetical protein